MHWNPAGSEATITVITCDGNLDDDDTRAHDTITKPKTQIRFRLEEQDGLVITLRKLVGLEATIIVITSDGNLDSNDDHNETASTRQ
uniref:Uncharacterized protein n=1 Tax=Oryza sativa subsp. japonica TaxID=39947 RepID=Q5VN42_ORYSJ|nr:hypothetical protein [Oryza sativa Japonica Group]